MREPEWGPLLLYAFEKRSSIMSISLLYCIPFAGLLLSIAIVPLFAGKFWGKYYPLAVVFWSLAFIIPSIIGLGGSFTVETVLDCIFNDYMTFIILLFGLYCVSSNITIHCRLASTPKINTIFLAIGTLLSSIIGTTGASMLLLKPLLRINTRRGKKTHLVVFFIFLISNMGGCLTPIGDPPLLMGFSRGVPFFWDLKIFPILLINMVILLTVFYLFDSHLYKKEMTPVLDHLQKGGTSFRSITSNIHISGKHNLIFLIVIILAVILSGYLPTLSLFQDASGSTLGIHIYKDVMVSYPELIEVVMILLAAFGSQKTTKRKVDKIKVFSWDPIKEVAILFVGIFITMQPALIILKGLGNSLTITHPWEFFAMTGALSSFLDNTPTYLVFFTMACSMGFTTGLTTTAGVIPIVLLKAITSGAVFAGAVTYIGNAPNMMVKNIAEERGIKMPSFFGYMAWSVGILVPVFVLDCLLFFR